jgi:hypothetical protein
MRTESIKALFPTPDKILRLIDGSLWKVRANYRIFMANYFASLCVFLEGNIPVNRIVIPKNFLSAEILVSCIFYTT